MISLWDVVTRDQDQRILHDTFATEEAAHAFAKTVPGAWLEWYEVEEDEEDDR